MIEEGFSKEVRTPKSVSISGDLVIVGGGMSGVCAAITAAREGVKVILVQDRPVLGGNASSEVRMWILGATSHLGNNNRWSREGGVIDEILVENLYRNREGNTIIFDTLLLEKVIEEENITLLLNTAACDVAKSSENRIESVRAFCSQNSTMYTLSAPLFCDVSGDGLIGFASGPHFGWERRAKRSLGNYSLRRKNMVNCWAIRSTFIRRMLVCPWTMWLHRSLCRILQNCRSIGRSIPRNMALGFGGWNMEVVSIRFTILRPSSGNFGRSCMEYGITFAWYQSMLFTFSYQRLRL